MSNLVLRLAGARIIGVTFALALALVIVLHGAVPFFLTPTLGQAVWTTGFAQSFINDSVFSIYAHNIGAPAPAAISFGLSGAWLSAVFMKLGFLAPDAYSAMVAVWLSVSFCAAYSIARHFSVSPPLSILAALCWLTMPVTWAHAGCSMLSTGIALLTLYFLASIKIFSWDVSDASNPSRNQKIWLSLYPVVCIISVFMDGYSFMMFASGASILGAWMFLSSNGDVKKRLAQISLPTHFAGLGIAYILYTLYIGKPEFEAAPIDFFRGWGVDLTFLFIPTRGVHWLADTVGWSVPRSGDRFFGDASVWITSFSIPVILGASWAAIKVFQNRGIVIGLILIALFGFYMSLGPSIKVNSVKGEGETHSALMAEKYAVAPTGSAILSKNVPGFRNMRAAYRWGGLGVWGAWALLVVAMSKKNPRKTVIGAAIFVGAIALLNLPDLASKLKTDAAHRMMFLALESELVDDLKKFVKQGERVAFIPWRNDFLVNYVASRLEIVTYNIGGDKNLEEARKHWPATMRSFPMASVDDDFSNRALLMLGKNEVDAVILPFIDMLWAAHRWPYPTQFKEKLAPAISQLNSSGFVDITNRDFYALVRLKPQFREMERDKFEKLLHRLLCIPPQCLEKKLFNSSTPTKVGAMENGKLVSTGKAGFMHFGPYVAMAPGRYQLIVRGMGTVSDASWVDVVSNFGKTKHAKYPLHSTGKKGDILAQGEMELVQPTQALEIRVFVSAEDEVALTGYELVPLQQ